MTRPRFPSFVYDTGQEPDARFTLANERTFLAWIRTSLALLAAGIALEVLGPGIHSGFRMAASIVLLVAGTAGAPMAWWSWARYEKALRSAQPLPTAFFALPVAIIVALVGVLILAGLLLA
ncbi:YidH family protein [Tessaracoccus sp. MC1756]|uniref:YidH family protein n=1 Tax=Tessaracoccus sp. MC1756 TaxID=2760311 RepID=UPI0015FF3E61|nr:DUF202 domain-containing protein [Tessaracoccus sp. MC1756]MBB1510689.1 DUF202 domain-containing protein [Tessaracoccus sp. MC1756]